MLFLCARPDAMVVPVLRQLMVERYGVTIGAAHAFMWVNLVGAMVCVRFIKGWQHRLGDRGLLVAAAFVNGGLLAAMALPIGFGPTLALRALEGAADLRVYAVLLQPHRPARITIDARTPDGNGHNALRFRPLARRLLLRVPWASPPRVREERDSS